MFSKKTKVEKSASLRALDGGRGHTSRGISMLSDGCNFEGKMFLNGEARLGGKIQGIVVSIGTLTIEETALITGQVNGDFIQLNGRVDGDVNANELLHLTTSARVNGNLQAKRLVVEDGARINGRVTFSEAATPAETKPEKVKQAPDSVRSAG